jgi:PadR family transcriptional regulator
MSTGTAEPIDGRLHHLDVLVLKALSLAPMHGWGIAQRIQQWSHDVLQINQGSLYPALQRLERDGLVTAQWQQSENNRRARYYRLTHAGRRKLQVEREEWERYARAVQQVLAAV